MSKPSSQAPWLSLLLGSVLLRLLYGRWVLHDHWVGDAGWYRQAAEGMRQGHMDPYWPPGLPAWLAGEMWLGIPQHWLGLATGLLFWTLFFWVLKAVVFPPGNKPQGWWIKVVFALFPAMIHQSVVPLTYLPVTVLVLMAWQWSSGNWGGPTWREGLGLGTVLGWMVLFRAASLALWPVLLWGYAWQRGKWRFVTIPLLVATAWVGVWEVALWKQEQRWVLVNSANSYNFYLGNNPWTPLDHGWVLGSHDFRADTAFAGLYAEVDSVRALPATEQDIAFRELAWSHILADPQGFFIRLMSRAWVLLSFDTLAGATLSQAGGHPWLVGGVLVLDAICFLALLAGAWWGWCSRGHWRRGERGLWLAACIAYSLPYLVAFAHPSFHLPLLPLFAWAAMKGGSLSVEAVWQKKWKDWTLLGLLLALQVFWVISWVD